MVIFKVWMWVGYLMFIWNFSEGKLIIFNNWDCDCIFEIIFFG